MSPRKRKRVYSSNLCGVVPARIKTVRKVRMLPRKLHRYILLPSRKCQNVKLRGVTTMRQVCSASVRAMSFC